MVKALRNKRNLVTVDLPPPGSRGGPDDIAAPFTGAGLEALKNVKNNDLIMNDVLNKIYLNAGVQKMLNQLLELTLESF